MTARIRLKQISSASRPRLPQTETPPLHVEIAPKQAKVFVLPGRFRSAEYVRVHVSYVVRMEAEKGERHIVRNLSCIGDRLREIGIDEPTIAAELRLIEAAVRSELWRQILTPSGDGA